MLHISYFSEFEFFYGLTLVTWLISSGLYCHILKELGSGVNIRIIIEQTLNFYRLYGVLETWILGFLIKHRLVEPQRKVTNDSEWCWAGIDNFLSWSFVKECEGGDLNISLRALGSLVSTIIAFYALWAIKWCLIFIIWKLGVFVFIIIIFCIFEDWARFRFVCGEEANIPAWVLLLVWCVWSGFVGIWCFFVF